MNIRSSFRGTTQEIINHDIKGPSQHFSDIAVGDMPSISVFCFFSFSLQ